MNKEETKAEEAIFAASVKSRLIKTGPATHILPVEGKKPITFIANDIIFSGFDNAVFQQAYNGIQTPGVDKIIVLPDSHSGFGVPVGSVLISKDHIYPGPVGPDKCCSMSYLQTNIEREQFLDKYSRRKVINGIERRIPVGANNRIAPGARGLDSDVLFNTAIYGASNSSVLADLGIPCNWGNECESASYGNPEKLTRRLEYLFSQNSKLQKKLYQLGSYGGGNHFGEAEEVIIQPEMEAIAEQFGLINGCIGFLSHCGSRGFGFNLSKAHFEGLAKHFETWGIPFPAGEKELVYAPIGTPEAENYILDMQLASNFAIVNHLLINQYILEAVKETFPDAIGNFVYHISHNIGRQEVVDNNIYWVFRKGSTRAFPAGHHALKGTKFENTGHPVLLPGNPEAGSRIMVGLPGAEKTAYSINHGAGRAMGRNQAKRTLNQDDIDASMLKNDILSNCRQYPIDESAAAYKNFDEVNNSIEEAGLAKTVAILKARFVIKDGDTDREGAA